MRVIWPFAFGFIHPWFVLLPSFLLDSIDWNALVLSFGWQPYIYLRADKLMDLVFYVCGFAFFATFWRELWYAPWLACVAAHRIAGQLIFFATKWEDIFVFFPNLFDPLLFVYGLLDVYRLEAWLRRRTWAQWALLVVVAVGKVVQEVRMHWNKPQDAVFNPMPQQLSDNCTDFTVDAYTNMFVTLLWGTVLACFLAAHAGAFAWPGFVARTVARDAFGRYVRLTTHPAIAAERAELESR